MRSNPSRTLSLKLFSKLAVLWIALLICVGTLMPAQLQAQAPFLAQAQQPEKVRLIIKTAKGLSQGQANALVRGHGGSPKASVPKLDLHIIEVPPQAADNIIKAMKGDAQILRVESDHTRKWQSAPSDTQYSDQWALPKISWDQVYGVANPRFDTKVAILDTGVDATHPDLASVVVAGTSILEGGNPNTDENGHGTWLAGIVAARTDNQQGIAGVGYDHVQIMPVKVLDQNGDGQDSDIVQGLMWAVDNGASVILMAFSAGEQSQTLQDAIDYAWAHNVVLVAAAGNNGDNTPTFPAGDRGVIGVSATDQSDVLAPSSTYGPSVFLAAPGVEILGTYTGGGYVTYSGTSASAAIVAGTAALMRATDPSLSNGVIVNRIARTADVAGTQEQTGNGRVNLQRAIDDTSTDELQPAGTSPFGNGGPFVGPYRAAASNKANVTFAGTGVGSVTVSVASGSLTYNTSGGGDCSSVATGNGTLSVTLTGTCTSLTSTASSTTGSLTATPNSSSSFGNWSAGLGNFSGCTTANPCSFTISSNSAITVTFNPNPPTKLAFSVFASPIVVGQCTAVTVQSQTAGGTASSVTSATTVNLSRNTGNGAFFSDGACTTSLAPANNVTIANGTSSASFFFKDTVAGTPTITAHRTAGTPALTDGTQLETINKANTSTAVTSNSNPSTTGELVTLTATISVTSPGAGTPGGTVNFKDGASSITGCSAQTVSGTTATCATTVLSIGSHTISAGYNGDSNFNTSTSSNLTQTVNAAPFFKAAISPTTDVVNHALASYSITITDCDGTACPSQGNTSNDTMIAANVAIPADYSNVVIGTVSAPGHSWSGVVSSGQIQLTANTGSDKLSPGDTVSVTFTATTASGVATDPTTETWTAAAYGGSGNTKPFAINSNGHPTVSLGRRTTSTAVGFSSNPITFGQSTTATVTVTDTEAAGTKSNPGIGQVITVNSDSGDTITGTCTLAAVPATTDQSSCQVTVTPTHASVHNISASFTATNTHKTSASGNAPLTVNKATPTVSVTGAPSTFDNSPHGATGFAYGNGGVGDVLTPAVTFSYVGTGLTSYGPTATAPTNAGTYNATASYAGDENYTANSATAGITINKTSQTITFAQPASPAMFNTSFGVAPTASSGLTVTVVPSGVCSILTNTVTMTSGTGVCTLTASQSGDSNYLAASDVVRAVDAGKASQSITFAQPASPVTFGGSFGVAPTATSGLTVTVTPSGVCSILGSTVTMTSGTGICTLTASQGGNINYDAASNVLRNVDAAKAGQSIVPTAPASKTFGDPDFNVTAIAVPSGLTAHFAGTTATVCTITDNNDGSATVHIVAAGACSLTATQSGDFNFSAATPVDIPITINQAQLKTLLSITNGKYPTSAYNDTIVLSAKVTDFSHSNAPLTTGYVEIKVYSGQSETGSVVFSATPTTTNGSPDNNPTLSLDSNGIATLSTTGLPVGGPRFIKAIYHPVVAGNYSFLTYDDSTIPDGPPGGTTVDGATCQSNCAPENNQTVYTGVSDFLVHTVIKANQAAIVFTPGSPLMYNDTEPLSITGGSGTGAVTFEVTAGSCTVVGVGLDQLKSNSGIGTCDVKATKAADGNYNPANATATVTLQLKSQTITFGALGARTYGDTDFTVGATATSGLTVTFSSLTAATCSVTGTTVHIVAAGDCTIRASQGGDTNYSAATPVDQTFTIAKKTLTASIIGDPTRPYNGNTAATLTSANFQLSGLVGTEDFTVTQTAGTYDSANVTSATTVTSSLSSGDFTPTNGAIASNYNLPTTASGAGHITPKTLTASIIGDPTRPYNGNTMATLTSAHFQLSGLVGTDNFTVTQTAGTYDSANVTSATTVAASLSAGDFTPTNGAIASNYNLPTTASGAGYITAKTVTASIIDDPTKPYDGNTDATLTSSNFQMSGMVGTENFTINQTAGNYNSANAATATTVTASLSSGNFSAVNGATASNYNLPSSASGPGHIIKANQTITIVTPAPATAAYQSNFVVAATASSGLSVSYSSGSPLVCSNLGATFTMLTGTGTCVVQYDQVGDSNHNAAPQLTNNTTAVKIDPTVTFTGAPATANYQSTFTVASTTSSSASPVYTSSGVCSNVGTLYTMTSGTGTCTSTVTWAADNNYNGATLGQSTTATKINPTVTFTGAPATANYQSTFTVASTTSSSASPVYTSSGVCSNVGTLYTMTSGTGTCTSTVTWAADNNYNGATLGQSTTATKINPTVTFTGAPATANYQSTFTVASTTSSSASPVYTSSGVCSNVGTLYTMTSGTGTCTSTVTWAADNNYNGATLGQSTTATKIDPTVTFTGAPATAGYQAGFAVASSTNSSTSPSYTSSGVCSNLGVNYTMTSGTGSCTPTVTWATDGNFNAATRAQVTTATTINPTVSLTAPPTANYQSTFIVVASTNASTSATITVDAPSAGVCSIVGTTVTMSSGTGTCALTASWPGDANYNPAIATSSTTANKINPTVTFTNAPLSADYQSPFTVASTTSASTAPVYTSSGVCSNVSTLYTLTSGTGTCTSTVTWATDANYYGATRDQLTTATKIDPTVTFTGAPASANYQSTFTVASTTNASTAPVYTSSGGCSNASTLYTMTSGATTCTSTVNWAADANYKAATRNQSTTAVKITPTVTFTGAPATAGYSTTFTVASTTNSTASPAYTFGGVCSNAGTLYTMTSGTGTCNSTVTWAADSNYNGATLSQSTDAMKVNQTINWSNPGAITFGTALTATQLNATVSVVGPAAAGALTYVPPSGMYLPYGNAQTLTVTAAATGNYNQAAKSVVINVGKYTTTTTISAASVQYSDKVTLSATVSPTSIAGSNVTGSVEFFINSVSQGSVAVTAGGTVTKVSAPVLLAPGGYTIEAKFTSSNTNFTDSNDTDSLTVNQEDARATYTGLIYTTTSSPTSSTASVVLSATIQDITATADAAGDVDFGDIRNATVTFINRDTNTPIATVPVGLVNLADTKTGTASFQWNVNIGSGDSQSYTIGVIVNNYYTRNTSAEDTVVTIKKPTPGSIGGGGYLVNAQSAGIYAGTVGMKTNFGLNVKFNKNNTNLQGNTNIIIRQQQPNGSIKVYQIKTNATDTLNITSPATGVYKATFTSKANVSDITNPNSPIALGGNKALQITMTDNGEPGSNDTISIMLTDPNAGGLLFSSQWTGTATMEQVLGGGNLQIRPN